MRTTRVRIIHLRNDHKDVMKYLEKGLHDHFANLQSTDGTGAGVADTSNTHPPASVDNSLPSAGILETPFAKVNSVVPGSPADQAGLKAGDTIRSFGSVNWINHERLSKVAEAVQQNEGVCSLLLYYGLLANSDIASFECQSYAKRGLCYNYGTRPPAHTSAKLGRTGVVRMPSCSSVMVHTLSQNQIFNEECDMFRRWKGNCLYIVILMP